MTDFYGGSGRAAVAERGPMTDVECERQVARLRACWSSFDEAAASGTRSSGM